MTPFKQIQTVLFDLDGTLLQVEMDRFIPAYIDRLAACFPELADDERFARTVRAATFALLHKQEGKLTNEELFLAAMQHHFGIAPAAFRSRLAGFCPDGLEILQPLIRPLPLSRNILSRCIQRGLQMVIATNPVFPRAVVEARLRWGNLQGFPFAWISHYENSRFCKPDPRYFTDLLSRLGRRPGQCLMVGNDTEHDLAARHVGISTFLVDTWLIQRSQEPPVYDFRGNHPDLFRLVGQLGSANL